MASPGLASAAAGREIPLDLLVARLRGRPWLSFALLAASAGLLYWWTDTRPVALDAFVPLANAFLHGQLHVSDPSPWIEHVDRAGGGWYVPYPPMPAVTVLPFVAPFGSSFDQGVAAALVGGLNVALLSTLLGKIGVAPLPQRALTAAFALGSVHWWAAGVGTSWLFAGVNGLFHALLGADPGQGRPVAHQPRTMPQ